MRDSGKLAIETHASQGMWKLVYGYEPIIRRFASLRDGNPYWEQYSAEKVAECKATVAKLVGLLYRRSRYDLPFWKAGTALARRYPGRGLPLHAGS